MSWMYIRSTRFSVFVQCVRVVQLNCVKDAVHKVGVKYAILSTGKVKALEFLMHLFILENTTHTQTS